MIHTRGLLVINMDRGWTAICHRSRSSDRRSTSAASLRPVAVSAGQAALAVQMEQAVLVVVVVQAMRPVVASEPCRSRHRTSRRPTRRVAVL